MSECKPASFHPHPIPNTVSKLINPVQSNPHSRHQTPSRVPITHDRSSGDAASDVDLRESRRGGVLCLLGSIVFCRSVRFPAVETIWSKLTRVLPVDTRILQVFVRETSYSELRTSRPHHQKSVHSSRLHSFRRPLACTSTMLVAWMHVDDPVAVVRWGRFRWWIEIDV